MNYKKINFINGFSPLILFIFIFQVVGVISPAAQTQTQTTTNDSQTINEPAVAEIIAKHLKAVGEEPKTAKTVETISEAEMNGETTKTYRIEDLASNRFYQSQESVSGKSEFAFDGKRMWRKTAFARGYMPESDSFFKASTMKRVPMTERKFKLLPNEKIDGKEYFALLTTENNPQGQNIETRYFFDSQTYLLKQMVTGNEIKQTTVYDDYRSVSGKMFAFSVTLLTPRGTRKIKTVSVKYDVPFDEKQLVFEETDSKQSADTGSPNEKSSSQFVKTSSEKIGGESEILPENVRLESFDVAWKTINESYWDKNFGGVNWQSIREKYLPLVKATERSDDFHRLLNRMFSELGRSHLRVFPASQRVEYNTKKEDLRLGTLGVDARWLDSELVVTEVKKDSSAANSGIRPGFVITRINGKTLEEIFSESARQDTGFQLNEAFRRYRAYIRQLGGKTGERITLEMRDDKDKLTTRELVLTEGALGGTLNFQHKRINQNIGYIKFNIFFGDVLTKFQTALDELRDTKGLIIDLRGNSGGMGNIAPAIVNLLNEKSGSLGTFTYRYEKNQMSFNGAGERAYRQPVIVLVDELSASTTEIFAAGLQESKRAFIVGTPTAGAVLPSLFQSLPTGGGMQYVVANFETRKGVVLEGKGITPDRPVKLNRADLLAGHDSILDAAVKLLEKSGGK